MKIFEWNLRDYTFQELNNRLHILEKRYDKLFDMRKSIDDAKYNKYASIINEVSTDINTLKNYIAYLFPRDYKKIGEHQTMYRHTTSKILALSVIKRINDDDYMFGEQKEFIRSHPHTNYNGLEIYTANKYGDRYTLDRHILIDSQFGRRTYHIEAIKFVGFLEMLLYVLDETKSDHAKMVGQEIRNAIKSLESSVFTYFDMVQRKIDERVISIYDIKTMIKLDDAIDRNIGATEESVSRMIQKETGIPPSNQRKYLKEAWILQRKLDHKTKQLKQ